MRTPQTLVGHEQPLLLPPESEQYDYEGELVLIIGKSGRRIPQETALDHIFGLTLANEGSVRDWLRHAKFNVTQGKNFDQSGAMGPWIVAVKEVGDLRKLDFTTHVNGELRQQDVSGNMIFGFAYLISYISTFSALHPGDVIITGTPTGAGARFDPPKWLLPGDRVEVNCPALGTLGNTVQQETVARGARKAT
jgi:2-keto-4-pentenoate hydratase/2-oxohepta-3-ene-1,7-dioic acid hydratase in catechol pathway